MLAREVSSRGEGTCAPWWLAHGATPTSGSAEFVDWIGERYGIEVDMSQGKPVLAFGELPLSLYSVSYRLIPNDAAARAARGASTCATS